MSVLEKHPTNRDGAKPKQNGKPREGRSYSRESSILETMKHVENEVPTGNGAETEENFHNYYSPFQKWWR